MPEDNNRFAIVSNLVNTEDDMSGKYFHVLKCLNNHNLLLYFLKNAEISHDIFPDKSVSYFFWNFCENMDLLHDEMDYVEQQVKRCKEGKITPFRLHRQRNLTKRSDKEALRLYLEEWSGMDLSRKGGGELLESYATY